MSPIDPFDTAEQFASLWGESGNVLLDAQRSLVQELAGWMPSVAPDQPPPDEGYEAARHAFDRSWETALDVSRAAMANLTVPVEPPLAATLAELLDPAAWFAGAAGRQPDAGHGDAAASPLAALVAATTLVQRRHLEHDVVEVEAWMQAAGAFARALNASTGAGNAPASPGSLKALWAEHAGPVFAEAERSTAARRSRDRLAAARGALEAAQLSVGEFYGYASRRELHELRETVGALRERLEEAVSRTPSGASPPAQAALRTEIAALAAEPVPATHPGETDVARTAPPPEPAVQASTADLVAAPDEERSRLIVVEPPPRYLVRSHGAGGPTSLLVGTPGDRTPSNLARGLAETGVTTREVVWSETAWHGSLDDLVHDLASALDDVSRSLSPMTLIGIGPAAIPLACLAAHRVPSALVVMDAALASDDADPRATGPGWLTEIQRDDSLIRGTLAVDGKRVDLAAITCPVLNLMSGGDGMPAAASGALEYLVASDDYAERLVTTEEAGPAIATWLTDRSRIAPRTRHDVAAHEVS